MLKLEELNSEINDLKRELYFFKKSMNDRVSNLENNKNT